MLLTLDRTLLSKLSVTLAEFADGWIPIDGDLSDEQQYNVLVS